MGGKLLSNLLVSSQNVSYTHFMAGARENAQTTFCITHKILFWKREQSFSYCVHQWKGTWIKFLDRHWWFVGQQKSSASLVSLRQLCPQLHSLWNSHILQHNVGLRHKGLSCFQSFPQNTIQVQMSRQLDLSASLKSAGKAKRRFGSVFSLGWQWNGIWDVASAIFTRFFSFFPEDFHLTQGQGLWLCHWKVNGDKSSREGVGAVEHPCFSSTQSLTLIVAHWVGTGVKWSSTGGVKDVSNMDVEMWQPVCCEKQWVYQFTFNQSETPPWHVYIFLRHSILTTAVAPVGDLDLLHPVGLLQVWTCSTL